MKNEKNASIVSLHSFDHLLYIELFGQYIWYNKLHYKSICTPTNKVVGNTMDDRDTP